MLEMQAAREVLSHLLLDLKDIDESVVRGEKRLGDQTYAVAYVDLADQVVARSKNLREFQERILGEDFFDTTGDLRWNKYLYIVAGPNSRADIAAFAAAKATIEADKDYARKRVISEDELESLLGGARLFEPTITNHENIITDWEKRLNSNELDLLLDCPSPRTSAVERISQGNAKRAISRDRTQTLNAADAHLSTSRLIELNIDNFRKIHNGKTYSFGQVNLIIGPNGSGKTSLLEAIEFLYCGHNRRNNPTSSLQIKAKLSKPETNEEYSLTSTTEAARIKARCLAWYNRDERNSKAIVDGFTRYNFLDTDAAFRISTDLEPSEVATDLSRLLVGPSAAIIWDYLTKVHADIERALEKTQGNAAMKMLVLETNEKALKELQEKPSVIKSLAEAYRQTIKDMGWLHIPKNSNLEASEGDLLLSAIGHLQALQAAGPAARTIGALLYRHRELKEAISQAAPHAKNLTHLHPKQQVLTGEIRNHEITIEHINRWIVYISSGFPRLLALAPKARHEAQIASAQLGKFAAGQLPEIPSSLKVISLEAAKHVANEALTQTEDRVIELRTLADNHGRTAAARATLATRLKDAVLASLAQTDNTNTCPVCKSTHPSGELSRLITAITEGTEKNPELQQITEALNYATTQSEIARTNLNSIQFIDEVASKIGLDKNLLTQDIIRQIIKLRNDLISLNEMAHSISKELHELEEEGLSSNEYYLICEKIESVLPGIDATIDAAISLRHELVKNIDLKNTELKEIQSKIITSDIEIRSICQRVINPQWSTSIRVNDTIETLIALHDELEIVITNIPKIQSKIEISDDLPLHEIQARLASASAAFKEAFLAAHNEAANSQELFRLTQAIKNGNQELYKTQGEANALSKAVDVLRALLADSSLEKATQESLSAIGDQINEVFSRIHAPREYEYIGKKHALLMTVATQDGRTLDQVSTGQRAAFALSIFLALNITAKSAPPILLIDDPIAHIDDLNALSFLDYLRDLTVNSGRQIFFATADTRIASLFSKKFSFLGDQFKTIQLTRSDSMTAPLTD